MNFHQNPNPSGSDIHFPMGIEAAVAAAEEFELSDYLVFDDSGGFGLHDPAVAASPEMFDVAASGSSGSSGAAPRNTSNTNIQCKSVGMRKNKANINMGLGHRVSFRTKSELEVMDDGFKWRKYGKKSVKNSPNPRNYYKCSSGGCNVKKRVERDREDSSFVITTYDGVHNHESPGVVYYNHMPLMVPNNCTLQASSPSSSSSLGN